jgi:hypothetical protein
MNNLFRQTSQFPNSIILNNNNKPKNKTITGTYLSKNYNIAFPVNSKQFPIGKSPYSIYIIIEKKKDDLVWGSTYEKAETDKRWIKSQFTGSILPNDNLELVVDVKYSDTGNQTIYKLSPTNDGFYLTTQIIGKGISGYANITKISNNLVVPDN